MMYSFITPHGKQALSNWYLNSGVGHRALIGRHCFTYLRPYFLPIRFCYFTIEYKVRSVNYNNKNPR